MALRDSSAILEAFPPPAADVRLVYGPEPLQFGDLRLPDGDGPHPLVVVLHGGYWKGLWNLIHTGHMCRALAAAGIATWNVEYRRIGDVGGGWPATAGEVRRALEFVAQLSRRGAGDGAVDALLGGSPEQVPDRYAAASPIALLPLGQRHVLVHGTHDSVVPYEDSVAYVEASAG